MNRPLILVSLHSDSSVKKQRGGPHNIEDGGSYILNSFHNVNVYFPWPNLN